MRTAELELDTSTRQVVDITDQVVSFCAGSVTPHGDGLASGFAPHSTAGLALFQPGDGSDTDLVETVSASFRATTATNTGRSRRGTVRTT